MERTNSFVNRLDSVNAIPPDIQQALLTIAQFGCRPDQVERWYILVREHFGCNAPPPVGNLYEHEIVIMAEPLLPASTPPSSTPASVPAPAPTLTPGHLNRSMSTQAVDPGKSQHGLGLRCDLPGQASIPDYAQTPVSQQTTMSFISPTSIASRADSALDIALTAAVNTTMSTSQSTPATFAGLSCPPAPAAFDFTSPGFSANRVFQNTEHQLSRPFPMPANMHSPSRYDFERSSTGMELLVPVDDSAVATKQQYDAYVSSDASTGTITPNLASSPGRIVVSPTERPLKRRRVLHPKTPKEIQRPARPVNLRQTNTPHTNLTPRHSQERLLQQQQTHGSKITAYQPSPAFQSPSNVAATPSSTTTTVPQGQFYQQAPLAGPTSFQHFQRAVQQQQQQQQQQQHIIYNAGPSHRFTQSTFVPQQPQSHGTFMLAHQHEQQQQQQQQQP